MMSGDSVPGPTKSLTFIPPDRTDRDPRRSTSDGIITTSKKSSTTPGVPRKNVIRRPQRRRPNKGLSRRVRQNRQHIPPTCSRGVIGRPSRRIDEDEATLNDVFSRLRVASNEVVQRPARLPSVRNIRQNLIVEQHLIRQGKRENILNKIRFGQNTENDRRDELDADIDNITEMFGKLTMSGQLKTQRKRKLPFRHSGDGPTQAKRLCYSY